VSQDIRAGDLVIVTGAGCPHSTRALGFVLSVLDVDELETCCMACAITWPRVRVAHLRWQGVDAWVPLSWLKKIDPRPAPVCADKHIPEVV
jgi:hypothetical protein